MEGFLQLKQAFELTLEDDAVVVLRKDSHEVLLVSLGLNNANYQ